MYICFNKIIMHGQKKISSFFTTKISPTTKRAITSGKENKEPNSKQQKLDSDLTNKNGLMQETLQKSITATYFQPSADKTMMQRSWKNALQAELRKPYYQSLMKFVEKERAAYTVYPPSNQVFSWTQHCDIHDVKVVILGQDPYHGPNQAHGLCFSVQQGISPPPSLVNMYKELESDIEGFKHPGHGNLSGWANQGVLLLNAVLTVRASAANSHKDQGWETFTDAVIKWISDNLDGVVFMLWGSYAQKKGARINTKRHHVLKTVHPSPLSAYRGFFGCKHFSKANQLLQEQGKKPIDWSAL